MNKEIVIKPLKKEDKKDYMELFSKLLSIDFPEYSEKTKEYIKNNKEESFKRESISPMSPYMGAFSETQLVGAINGIALGGGVAICEWLFIDPDFQHQGIGKKLLGEIQTVLKEKGIHSIHLYSAKWNKPFYKKMGFELVGLYKNGWYGSSDYLFAKTIQEPKEENYLK